MNIEKQVNKIMKAGIEQDTAILFISLGTISKGKGKLQVASNVDTALDKKLLALVAELLDDKDCDTTDSPACGCDFCEDMRDKNQDIPQDIKDFVSFLSKTIH